MFIDQIYASFINQGSQTHWRLRGHMQTNQISSGPDQQHNDLYVTQLCFNAKNIKVTIFLLNKSAVSVHCCFLLFSFVSTQVLRKQCAPQWEDEESPLFLFKNCFANVFLVVFTLYKFFPLAVGLDFGPGAKGVKQISDFKCTQHNNVKIVFLSNTLLKS